MRSELLPLIRVDKKTDAKKVAGRIRARSQGLSAAIEGAGRIVRTVRAKGDSALVRYSKELDGVTLRSDELKVPDEEVGAAAERVSPRLLEAMRFALKRIRRTQGHLLGMLSFSYVSDGYVVRCVVRPLDSVGCYIPGGRASYASTVLMTAGVAKLAGVKRIVVCSPPTKGGKDAGKISDAILAEWPAHPDWVYAMAMSPDGSKLASGDWSGAVRLWDVHGSGPAPAVCCRRSRPPNPSVAQRF